MPTKEELEQANAALLTENAELRAALEQTAPARSVSAVPRRPFLSEGERQELEMRGVVNSPFTGERLTREQVLDELAQSDTQSGVQIAEPDAGVVAAANLAPERDRAPIEGLDYIPVATPAGK